MVPGIFVSYRFYDQSLPIGKMMFFTATQIAQIYILSSLESNLSLHHYQHVESTKQHILYNRLRFLGRMAGGEGSKRGNPQALMWSWSYIRPMKIRFDESLCRSTQLLDRRYDESIICVDTTMIGSRHCNLMSS